MSPAEKARFWAEVYTAAVRAFQTGPTLGGHGTAVSQVTKYAAQCADEALKALNARLEAQGHFN